MFAAIDQRNERRRQRRYRAVDLTAEQDRDHIRIRLQRDEVNAREIDAVFLAGRAEHVVARGAELPDANRAAGEIAPLSCADDAQRALAGEVVEAGAQSGGAEINTARDARHGVGHLALRDDDVAGPAARRLGAAELDRLGLRRRHEASVAMPTLMTTILFNINILYDVPILLASPAV